MTSASLDVVERAARSRDEWLATNRLALTAALDDLRERLERAVDGASSTTGPAEATAPRDRGEGRDVAPALAHLCTTFGLSAFERSVLLMCVGPELDSRFAALYGQAHHDPRLAWPTFGLALATLPDAHWSALTPAGPLRHWRLVEVAEPAPLVDSRLRVDERVLHFLLGIQHVDARLAGAVSLLPAASADAATPAAVRHLADALASGDKSTVIALSGPSVAERRAAVAAACAALEHRVLVLHASDVPQAAAERDGLFRLVARELALTRGVLLLETDERAGASDLAARQVAEGCRGALVVSGSSRPRELPRRILSLDLRRPDAAPESLEWPRAGLDDVAQRIEPAATWADIVLPDAQVAVLREMAGQLRQRDLVYEQWGFAAKSRRGLGITALFSGPSGTGKTMAAEVMANELSLALYRVDLSQVVSKYIGETEKNLGRVFDAAEDGRAILLFDEADALFGRRSEVKDSHDRYANVEISYLLQRMEAYRGLAILTTNMRSALDAAFLRRLRFVVTFPFPDASQRAEIWRRIFPPQTPTAGLQVDKLARLNVAGGNIRNIAMNAAFLAAGAGGPVSMAHLAHAARSECAKLERPIADGEIAGWVG
jgi:hypothetical protein